MESIQRKRLTGAAAIVMSSLVVSRITGFIREMLIPSMLGSNEIGDAYNLAFRITDLMYFLLVGGAISAALIPVLTGYIAKNEEEEGWKAVGTFINVTVGAIVIFCILGIIFAPQLVPLVTLGYNKNANPEQLKLVIQLTRILFPSVALLMLAGFVNGVLNSYQRFAAAAYGPSLYNILSALSILFLSRISVQSVAYGVMSSSLIYFIFQLSFALKNLKFYKLKIYLKHPGFIRLFKLAIPSLVSSSIAQVNVLITSMFTTLYPKGSIVALSTADKIWQTPYGIFAQGIGTALLPTLSSRHAVGDEEDYKNVLMKGLKTVLLLSVPSAIGLAVLRRPIVTFFKFSSLFDDSSITSAQNILLFFTIALIGQSIVAIMNRGFYAAHDTKTPLYIGSGTIAVNVALCYVFYRYTDLGVAGMSLAYSITSLINAYLLTIILNRKMKGFDLKEASKFFLKILFASIIMGISLYIMDRKLGIFPYSIDFKIVSSAELLHIKLRQLISVILEVTAGAMIYFVSAILLKVKEMEIITDLIYSKIKKISSIQLKK